MDILLNDRKKALCQIRGYPPRSILVGILQVSPLSARLFQVLLDDMPLGTTSCIWTTVHCSHKKSMVLLSKSSSKSVYMVSRYEIIATKYSLTLSLVLWAQSKKALFNPEKCKVLTLRLPSLHKLSVNGLPVPVEAESKYVDIYFQLPSSARAAFSVNYHIQELAQEIWRRGNMSHFLRSPRDAMTSRPMKWILHGWIRGKINESLASLVHLFKAKR